VTAPGGVGDSGGGDAGDTGDTVAAATRTVRAALIDSDVDVVEVRSRVFEATVRGERKLQTTVRFEVGDQALGVHAFVARQPDENWEQVYRWLLGRNLRMYAVAFAVDAAGDIWLAGRVPLQAVTADEVDRLLGSVATYADESFNTILETGFATSIRKEWEWRRARGESTRNLDAFRGWLDRDT